MSLLSYLLVFVFGSIIGSFLNVLILRYNTGRSLGGRSSCMSCGHKLSWRELVPVLSFFVHRGRCRYCKTSVSWQYPLVESMTGLVFVAVVYKELLVNSGNFIQNLQPTTYNLQPFLIIFYFLFVWSLHIAITLYDLRHKIIPDGMVWTFVLVSAAKLLLPGGGSLLYGLLAGLLLALPFVLIWLLSDGKAMGLGDAKLSLGAGFMLGFSSGVSALLVAFWAGGLVSLFLLFGRSKEFNMKSEVPFAPFLVLGMFTAYFFSLDLLGLAGMIG